LADGFWCGRVSERAPYLDRFGSDGRQLDAADGLTAYLRAAVLTMRPAQARARATLAIADRSRRHLVRAPMRRDPPRFAKSVLWLIRSTGCPPALRAMCI